jgi:glycosyltransferase involved in cell wall biosynthesis
VAHIRILMATRNGARFLSEQLASIAAQSHADWSLWCSDDTSDDDTCQIIETFRAAHPDRDIRLFQGPGRGSAANFLSLLARGWRAGDWLAFCDQDDVWMPDRLARAFACLGTVTPTPAGRVYASRTILTDADLNPLGPSRQHPAPPRFANALVQNILAGNTIVADPAAAALLHRTAPAALAGDGVAHHDWWVYLITSGAGAAITIDDRPGVFYRQHDHNTMAAHRGTRQNLSRIGSILRRDYADWIDRNLGALTACEAELTPPNRALLEQFGQWRAQAGRPFGRASLGRLGIRRQSRAGNLALSLMSRIGRL